MTSLRTFAETVRDIWDHPGVIAYSGLRSWTEPSDFYFVGINPGGTGERTLGEDLDAIDKLSQDYSAYETNDWGNPNLQAQFRHLVSQFPRGLYGTPCSNGVFIASRQEHNLPNHQCLLTKCWPFHKAVIEQLQVKSVICLGVQTGAFFIEQLGAPELKATLPVVGGKPATHEVHSVRDGLLVFTLIYPSRGHEWVKDDRPTPADPTEWMLTQAGHAPA